MSAETWDNLSDSERWELLNKTDMRGLEKTFVALMPWAKIKAVIREKIETASTKKP